MRYKGGKNYSGVYQRIINQIPPHSTYIEPFLGSGAIMRMKRPAIANIGIDVDAGAIASFRIATGGDVSGVTTIHGDAISFLKSYKWQGDEFVYADPPYLMETRSYQEPLYRHEFATLEEHQELLSVLISLPCPVAISGYPSKLYDELHWRVISYPVMVRGGRQVTECLWMNYPEPFELHDYQYLGSNYRERERIKKQQKRWRRMLAEMPTLKRLALLDVINQQRRNDHTATRSDAARAGSRTAVNSDACRQAPACTTAGHGDVSS